MSLHVFLNQRKLQKLKGFTVENGSFGKLKGMPISEANSNPHIVLSDIHDDVPKIVEEIVDGFSFREKMESFPRREFGVYRLNGAEAVLEPSLYNEKWILVKIKIKFPLKTMFTAYPFQKKNKST